MNIREVDEGTVHVELVVFTSAFLDSEGVVVPSLYRVKQSAAEKDQDLKQKEIRRRLSP